MLKFVFSLQLNNSKHKRIVENAFLVMKPQNQFKLKLFKNIALNLSELKYIKINLNRYLCELRKRYVESYDKIK